MKFRITKDNWLGYEVRVWRWYWPFWCNVRSNTHVTLGEARRWAALYHLYGPKLKPYFVEYYNVSDRKKCN